MMHEQNKITIKRLKNIKKNATKILEPKNILI